MTLLDVLKAAKLKGVSVFINSFNEWLFGPSEGFVKVENLEELINSLESKEADSNTSNKSSNKK